MIDPMGRMQTHGRHDGGARLPVGAADILGLIALILVTPAPAQAQTSPRGVPAIRPDQLSIPAPVRTVTPRPAAARKANAPIQPFLLTKVVVEGSTLPQAILDPAYTPFVGKMADNAALTAVTNAIAAVYVRSDVALYTVLVPEQRFDGGVLRLSVIEGHIGRIEIRGKLRKSRLALLRAYLRPIERERPLRTSTLQRAISLVRDMPGVTAAPAFNQGDGSGAVTLVVPVSEKVVQVAAGINDRGTALLGRTQAQVDVLVNGIVAGGDQLRATVVLPTHTSRFQYYAGSYATPIDANGTSVTGNLSYLRTRPEAIPLQGDATSFGVQITHALIRRYDRNLYVTGGVDGINSNNALFGFTLSNDRVRTLRLGASYTTATKRNQVTLSGTASFGLDVLGARVVAGQAKQRFRKINGRVNDSLQIGRSFVLRVNGFGQMTGDDLPSSEQIALGGDEFGRAYEAALISGDRGYAGSAELAWVPSKGLPTALKGSELYLYSDAGRVTYRGRYGGEAVTSRLASFGGGVRMHLVAKTVAQIECVRGLTNPVPYEDRENERVLFSIRSLL